MKKVKCIALILVLALGLIGGAYALWTDSLSIDATVETGVLDHTWWLAGHFPNLAQYNAGDSWHYGTVNPYIWGNYYPNDVLVLEMGNMYPGAEVVYYPRIENTGTIPSKIVGAKVEFVGGNQDLFDEMEVYYVVRHWDANNQDKGVVVYNPGWMPLEDLEAHLNANIVTYAGGPNTGNQVVLNPGDTLRFDDASIHFRVSPNAGNNVQDTDVQFTIEFLFEQGV